uniref:Uncharacterized protein n=1 Tax=Lepeophtheirus salmonis TaxID=72036 RepID=A0A0K2TAH4_LEPSM
MRRSSTKRTFIVVQKIRDL